ncbi:rab geranylgeranyltransferase [Catenaria anguillulae PL171]|uniref:Geranylgeranyl transferase type-2 subunit beta n=1 Tax=Catenaria anguillulae PL171 TaxID=765915 RepID=A0A1Y2I1Z8_9FUNG|nr:rab geranylgeranyltransferase [Catenaria anguillulae PL171]
MSFATTTQPPLAATPALVKELHVKFIQSLDSKKDELEYWMTENLRLNGIYWGVTALFLLGSPDGLVRDDVIRFVLSCHNNDDGGFGAFTGHDSHILSTLSAIQILATYGALDQLPDRAKTVQFIVSLQKPNGSFPGDKWGETDARFSYCAASALTLLGAVDAMNVDQSVKYILSCQNFDGGFGTVPGAESHGAMAFCCVGTLHILDRLHLIPDPNALGWWLSERQLPVGGLNGRPDKLEDVCYSWWVLSALAMIGRVEWINREKLVKFILQCQDSETGGIADRPGDMPDVFHTLFGIAGLSLLGYPGLEPVDPTYCMPAGLIKSLGIYRAPLPSP